MRDEKGGMEEKMEEVRTDEEEGGEGESHLEEKESTARK